MKRVKQTYIARTRILLFILQLFSIPKLFKFTTLFTTLYSKCNREVSYDNDTEPKNREIFTWKFLIYINTMTKQWSWLFLRVLSTLRNIIDKRRRATFKTKPSKTIALRKPCKVISFRSDWRWRQGSGRRQNMEI